MNILVINAGSSSLKFQLFESDSEDVILRGHYDGIGSVYRGSCLRKINGEKESCSISSLEQAIFDMLRLLEERRAIGSLADISAVGHRVVHGGENYSSVTEMSTSVIDDLKGISHLAPLHNPASVSCIEVLVKTLPRARQFAVFDTAFHQTMPEEYFLYGLPMEMYRKHGIRKYGFHGTSHKYLSRQAAKMLGRPIETTRIITCHLGNGQSICAVRHGKSLDTSMGFTPLEGLPMGTRSGSFDPEIVLFILGRGYTKERISEIINKESGLLGLSGLSSDHRVVEERAMGGDLNALRANNLLMKRIVSVIGSYMAEMRGVDAVVFSGGIGEHSSLLRKEVLSHFEYLGLRVDEQANESHRTIITEKSSVMAAMVVPANEELQICREVRMAMTVRGAEDQRTGSTPSPTF